MKKRISKIIVAVVLGLVVAGAVQAHEADRMQREIAGKILRFHVLANSDSEEDQELKLDVRDAVGAMMAKKLAGAAGLEQCRQIVTDNLSDITEVAEQTICAQGYDYPVSATVTQVDFPVKKYGEYSFPAGTYEALEVVIGVGEGHNWWCVMYPNMCFAGSTYAVVEDDAKEKLEETLTHKEYQSLLEDKEYTVKFKYLTFLNKYLE